MKLELSEKCINELTHQLAPIVFREDFAESLYNHYLEPNNIKVPDDIYEGFVDDVYEHFNEYNDYETSWDSALESAMDNLTRHGDYVLYSCDNCEEKVIVRGDDASIYEDYDGFRYCKECFEERFVKCQKCGYLVMQDKHPIIVHGRHYCNDCAQELLTHLMQPDVSQTTNE